VSILAVISQVLMPMADGKGVIAAFEVMIMNPAIENHIRKAETFKIPSTIQTSRHQGMFLLDDHLVEMAKDSKITKEMALSRAQNRRTMEQKLEGMQ
jgi:twitching motility protein PilT